jgi:PKD repeat protein
VGIFLRPEKVETTVKLANRKGVRLGLVAALAATGLVGVTSLTASGQTPPPQEVVGELVITVPGGSVRTATVEVFKTDTNGVRLDDNANLTQVFTATAACPTLESTLDSVLSITATPAGIPVLPNNGIGVTDNTSCGASGAVVEGEALSLALLTDTLPELFGGDVDVRGGSITVFRDPGGGNLTVGFDGGGQNQLGGPLGNGLNAPRTFTDRFENSIQISSTSQNSNKGIYLRGATFTLVRDIQNQAPTASFTAKVQAAPNVRTVDFDETSSDPDGTVVTWEWNFGDDNTKTINRVPGSVESGDTSHTYDEVGSYLVTLTVTDNLGRTFTTTSQNVNILNQAPTASFAWNATTLTVDFLDGSSDPDIDGTVDTWKWNFGDDNTKTINRETGTVESGDTSHTYAAAGEYTVTLIVTDNLGQASTAFTDVVIVEGTAVFCSEPVTASGDAATATFLRGENGDKFSDPCADVGVIVEVVADSDLGDYVFWDNSFTGVNGTPQDVNGLVTIKWQSIDPADQAEVDRMNNRLIDYTGLADGIQPKTQSYCLDFEQTIGLDEFEEETFTFNVQLPDWPWFRSDGTPEPGFILVKNADGVEERKVPWCLVSDTRVVDEFGNITQTEVLYGRGDPAKLK